ncbi:MAG: nuclear transport factor 2 family protein [Psychroflexus sp.]|nr:nuclear transport factor 2 family protein [Psychroflexus sp.]MDN6309482.1 nuclear transport factor 2 family protein [Psychroflexus sp.]
MRTKLFFLCFGLQCCLFAQDKNKINQTLDNWHQAAATADEETYFETMTVDAHFIGSDADENWEMDAFKAYAMPHFQGEYAWVFVPQQRHIYFNKDHNTAWFDETLESEHMGLCSGSGVLVKSKNEWKIAHYVLSILVPNTQVKQVVKAKRQHDKNFLKNSVK